MSGRRRFLYAIPAGVSAATALLAVLCMLRGLEVIEQPFPGFFYYLNGTLASMQRGGWEGPAAGLEPGARVITVDGEPVSDGIALRRALSRRAIREVVTLEVSSPDSDAVRVVGLRLRLLTTTDVLATFVLPYSIGVAFLLIGTVIFFLKRSYQAALALSVCTVASVFYLTTFDAHTAHYYSRLWISYPLLGAVSVHLFSAFPALIPKAHRPRVLALPYGIAAAILAYGQIVLPHVIRAPVPSILSNAFLSGCFIADLLLLTVAARSDPSETVRNKAKTIRVGLLVTAAAGLVWSLIVRISPELITAERAMMLSGLFPLLLAYAIIKKNLFDVDFVLRTTAIYAVATTAVLGLYFGAVYVIGLAMSGWTQRYVGFHANLETAVVSTIVAVLIFHPLRMRVQRLVDHFFFRGKAELQSALERIGKDLASVTVDLHGLGERLTGQVHQLMRCRYVVLLSRGEAASGLQQLAVAGSPPAGLDALVGGGEPPLLEFLSAGLEPFTVGGSEEGDPGSPTLDALRRAEVNAVVPLRAGSVLAGALLLGPRPSADPYGRFDLTALRALAVPAGLALEHALLLREHTERERLAALGKLSAVIIHEIKNPLGIIRVSSGTLKRRFAPNDSGHELASFIEEEVMRMDRTIAQFLRFARPSQPKVTRFDLADLARRAVEASRAELEQAGITLTCELPEELHVRGDPDQLQQVMLNLLLNARQALEGRQEPRIALCLRRAGSPPLAELVVKDNGPGIDPAVEARIFEPFFTTRPSGTGLGLAIVRQLLQDQGGRISVRTGAQGTEFSVLLPAA